MKKTLVAFCLFFLLIGIIFGLARSVQFFSGGMRLDKIETSYPLPQQEEKLPREIEKILCQPFSYYDKGSQAYVFISQDQKYVLKLLRFNRYRTCFWQHFFEQIGWRKEWFVSRSKHKKKRLRDSLRSYQLADKELLEETAIVYTHLCRSQKDPLIINLFDRLGRSWKLQTYKTAFILQKKATNFVKSLEESLHDKEAFRSHIQNFLSMTLSCYNKKIIIKDYNCIKNAAICEKSVINCDLGSFYPVEGKWGNEEKRNELLHFVKHFRKWGERQGKSYLAILDKEIEKVTTERLQ